MKPYLIGGALALAVLAATALYFTLRPVEYTNYPPHTGPIVAFGDSLVQGVGASSGKDFVTLLAQKVGEPIENFGVSGNTTAQALERIDEALAQRPRIVLILLGGNDYLRRIPREQTFANLSAIIDRFQQEGAVVVLLGVRGGVLVDNFATPFENLAKSKGAVYVSDVLKGLLGKQEYMTDEIHPNDKGYGIIAKRVFQALQPVLK
jgi:acyl-CoA thioesterase I